MDIVEELRTDREKGAKRLVGEYKAGLMSLARRFFVNESDAEELVNATFAKVVANIDGYLEQSAFFAWMCQILTNEFRDSVKRKSHTMEICPGVLPEMPDEHSEEEIFRNLDHSLLRDAIESLPEEMKEAIMMHYIAEQPIPVVARFLRLPVSTVKWRLHVARKELARRLGAKVGDAMKKPGAKVLLLALALCGLTALGAATSLAVVRLLSPATAALEQQAYNSKGAAAPSLAAAPLREGGGGGAASSQTAPLQEGKCRGATGGSTSTAAQDRTEGTGEASAADAASVPPVQSSSETDSSTHQTPPQEQTMNATTLRTLAASAAIAAATGAAADTYTWTGASSAVWNKTDANWDKGAWVDGNVAVFPSGVSSTDITLGADVTVSGLQLAGDWSLGGAHTMTLRVSSGNFIISQTSRASLKLKDGISVQVNSACENNINRLDIENASLLTSSGIRFHNGWNNGSGLSGGATINVGNGGVLGIYEFVHSPSTSAADADIYRVNVTTGGTFRLNHFLTNWSIDTSRYGTICFDGGKLEMYLDGNGKPFANPSDTLKLLVGPGGMHIAGDYAIYLRSPIGSVGGTEDGGVWIETGKLVRMFNDAAPQQESVNTFTGPVHMNQGGSIILINGDRNLGAVPAEPKTGIVFDKWGRILSQGNVVIHENRNILVNSNTTAVLATDGAARTLTVRGTISGDAPGTARNGTLSTDSDFSGGAISIEPPAGRTNSIGRILVKKHDLTIGGEGVTEITDTLGNLSGTGDNGVFAVLGGATLNVTNGLVRVMTNNYTVVENGNLNVSGGVLDLSRQKLFVNAHNGAATTTVSRAGTLIANQYCLSLYQAEPECALTRLQTGGTLVFNEIYMHNSGGKLTARAQIDFDGGVLAPQTGTRSFLGNSPEWYTNILCVVKEGGAVISNDVEIWTHHPFLSGAEHDGGLHKWGTASLATITREHTFNGPVEVHQGRLVWGDNHNYPVGTTLVVHEGATASLNLKAQTLARVEGGGTVEQCPYLAVTEAIAPGLGADAPGTLTFQDTLTLGCDLELDPGDTLKVTGGQDISGLRLKLVNASAFDKEAPIETYKILDAPGGYTGTFNVGGLSDMWRVKYRANAAYLVPVYHTTIILR